MARLKAKNPAKKLIQIFHSAENYFKRIRELMRLQGILSLIFGSNGAIHLLRQNGFSGATVHGTQKRKENMLEDQSPMQQAGLLPYR